MKSIHNIPSHQPLLESHYTVPPPNYPYPPKSHLIIATTATLNKQTNKRRRGKRATEGEFQKRTTILN